MNEECYYRVSVKGVVIDEDGRYLLTREDNGMWELLGGGLDHDEDTHKGLWREIMEETGLNVTSISEAPLLITTCRRQGADTYIANIIYQIELENLDFKPSDECQELRFFSVDEMSDIPLFPNVEKMRDVLKAKLDTVSIHNDKS